MRIAFFGTAPLAIQSLDALETVGLVPALIVAGQDRLAKDKSIILPPEKAWALKRGIEVIQPNEIDDAFLYVLRSTNYELFVVASYGKILTKALLEIPKHGTINMHPSLLPKLRGPSPIRSAILNDERETGVSVMILDEKMDHGPLIGQKKVNVPNWPPRGRALDELLSQAGAALLAEVLPQYLAGHIEPAVQDHSLATYSKIFLKEDGELDLGADSYQNLLKIRAFEGWPGTYAFFQRGDTRIRVVIVDAHLEGTTLVIDTVKPEGKSPMPYDDFVRSGAKPV